jgi:sugar/nucleoside kinase (ribokinase family)
MIKILGIGNALVDVLTQVENELVLENLKLPKGSMQLVDAGTSERVSAATAHFKRSRASGGSASNTIHGLAQMGIETAFIGHVGQDETGDFFYNDMVSAGIKPVLFRSETPTGIANAMITPDGERTFATYLGAAVELSASHLDKPLFEGYDMLYVEGYLVQNEELLLRALQLAKEAGLKIVLDLASYNVVEANKALLERVLDNYIDIVFANEEESKAFTGAEPEEALDMLAERCWMAVVKVGSKGSLIKQGETKVTVGTIKVNSVDTTGAGDLFAAGFLYALSNGYTLERAGKVGALLAGRVIELIGPKMDQQRWRAIKEEMQTI